MELEDNLNPLDPEEITRTTSQWQNKSCCSMNLAYFPIGDFWVWNHWIVKLLRPVSISLVYVLITILALYDLFAFPAPTLGRGLFCAIFIVSTLCLSISYFMVIARGPGYLPFNYRTNPSTRWEDLMSSIVVYKEQEAYARDHPGPPRSAFTRHAKRFVLRADHHCQWMESWIGIRNHRHFMLTLVWAIVYIAVWYSMHAWFYKRMFSPFHWTHVASLVVMALLLIPLLISVNQLVRSMRDLARNITMRERVKKYRAEAYDKGCFNNYAEVCGEKRYCCLWVWPCFPLEPVENGMYQSPAARQICP